MPDRWMPATIPKFFEIISISASRWAATISMRFLGVSHCMPGACLEAAGKLDGGCMDNFGAPLEIDDFIFIDISQCRNLSYDRSAAEFCTSTGSSAAVLFIRL